MFIKDQDFKDEDTLLEMLFDFGLGEPSALMKELTDAVDNGLAGNEKFQEHLATMEEEDRMELYSDVQQENLMKLLMQQFDSFSVKKAHLYGIKDNEPTLLYTMDDLH